MDNKKFFVVILFILALITNTYVVKISAETNEDYLNNALKRTNSTIEEIGVDTKYNTNTNGKKECKTWLEVMKFNNKRITIDDGKNYCVEFNNKQLSGYIESIKKASNYDILIHVKLLTDKNIINELKRKVIKPINYKSVSYIYIKAKSKIKNINIINNNIKSYFIKKRAKNLKTTRMNKILSTTLYTGKYDYIFDDNKKVDLNYAVCKYNDGNYVIIGTPILNINY
ncbi:hypothetical protein ACJDT4_08610 [Clostridium neuense]|uniref:TATA-box binding protein n=1 Tax=Clostridium neuense TaxID=1728934 RepID=A0ABW8TDK1_9CLOT